MEQSTWVIIILQVEIKRKRIVRAVSIIRIKLLLNWKRNLGEKINLLKNNYNIIIYRDSIVSFCPKIFKKILIPYIKKRNMIF